MGSFFRSYDHPGEKKCLLNIMGTLSICRYTLSDYKKELAKRNNLLIIWHSVVQDKLS